MSNKQKLLNFIKEKKIVKSHEVTMWGAVNCVVDAGRLARLLAQDGEIVRLDEIEQAYLRINSREKCWKIKGFDVRGKDECIKPI